MKAIVLISCVLFSGLATARPWTMDGGTTITIDSYDPVTKLYEMTYLQYPAQGPLVTTAANLAHAIKAINLERLERNPTSVVSSQYTTDADMILLLPDQVDAIKNKNKPKSIKPEAKKPKEKKS